MNDLYFPQNKNRQIAHIGLFLFTKKEIAKKRAERQIGMSVAQISSVGLGEYHGKSLRSTSELL